MQGSRFGSPIIIQRYASPSRAVVVPSVGRLAVSFYAFVRKLSLPRCRCAGPCSLLCLSPGLVNASPGSDTVLLPKVTSNFVSTLGVKPGGVWASATAARPAVERICDAFIFVSFSCLCSITRLVFQILPVRSYLDRRGMISIGD